MKNRNLSKEYHNHLTPQKCRSGIGGYYCSCCRPIPKPYAKRILRRTMKKVDWLSEF